MSLHLITPPTDPVITLDEARQHLRAESNFDDALVEALINAAVSNLDPAGGGWLGRALRPQVWELRAEGFPCWPHWNEHHHYRNGIELPYPPLVSVESATYDDANGVEQTMLEGTDFRVVDQGSLQRSYLAPLYGRQWPASVRRDPGSVRIRYTAGYPLTDDNSPALPDDRLPDGIKAAVLLMIGDLYEFRETVAVGAVATSIPVSTTVESLLAPHRVY
jgi:uncharacterized phiE125 gp8 family phage protein